MKTTAKPTPGPWVRTGNRIHMEGPSGNLAVAAIIGGYDGAEEEANGELMTEAGTVYHETGLSPREILAQRDELLKAVIHVLGILESPKPNKPGGVSRDMLREAIAKVMNEGINASKGGEKG